MDKITTAPRGIFFSNGVVLVVYHHTIQGKVTKVGIQINTKENENSRKSFY